MTERNMPRCCGKRFNLLSYPSRNQCQKLNSRSFNQEKIGEALLFSLRTDVLVRSLDAKFREFKDITRWIQHASPGPHSLSSLR